MRDADLEFSGGMSVHDVSFEHRPPLSGSGAAALRRSVRNAVRWGSWIDTDSEYVAQEAREIYNVEPHRVVTVPLGVSLPPETPHPAPGPPYVLALPFAVSSDSSCGPTARPVKGGSDHLQRRPASL